MLTPFERAAVESAPRDSRVRRLVDQHGTSAMRHALQLLDRIGDDIESARRCWYYAQALEEWEDREDWMSGVEEANKSEDRLRAEYAALVGSGE